MAGFRRGMYLRPVNTVKHVIDQQDGIAIAAKSPTDIIRGKEQPVLANRAEVNVGAHVKSFFLNVQIAASSTAALANLYFIIYGNPGNNIGAGSIPAANAVGVSDFKKQVFHQEMLMTEKNTTAFARTMFRGVIKIPRKFQRIGFEDAITISFFAPGVTFDVCWQAIYKEIR